MNSRILLVKVGSRKKRMEHRFLERTGLVKSVEYLHGQIYSFGKSGKHGPETDAFSQLVPEVGRALCDIVPMSANEEEAESTAALRAERKERDLVPKDFPP